MFQQNVRTRCHWYKETLEPLVCQSQVVVGCPRISLGDQNFICSRMCNLADDTMTHASRLKARAPICKKMRTISHKHLSYHAWNASLFLHMHKYTGVRALCVLQASNIPSTPQEWSPALLGTLPQGTRTKPRPSVPSAAPRRSASSPPRCAKSSPPLADVPWLTCCSVGT